MSMLKSAASATIAIAVCHASLAEGLLFKSSPPIAGRASLTEEGFRDFMIPYRVDYCGIIVR